MISLCIGAAVDADVDVDVIGSRAFEIGSLDGLLDGVCCGISMSSAAV